MFTPHPVHQPGARLFFYGLRVSKRTLALVLSARAAGYEVVTSGEQASVVIGNAKFARTVAELTFGGNEQPVRVVSSQQLRNWIATANALKQDERRFARQMRDAARHQAGLQRRRNHAMRRQHRLVSTLGKRGETYRIGF